MLEQATTKRCAATLPDSSIREGVRCALPDDHEAEHRQPPYPWCHSPFACTAAGRCTKRVNCGD